MQLATEVIDITPEAQRYRELAGDLVQGSGRSDTPFGLYVLWSSEPAAELARKVEQDVFYEVFGNTPELLAEEYDQYEAASLFLLVMDHERLVPAGVMRIIRSSPAGFKSIDDIEGGWGRPGADLLDAFDDDLDPEHLWDIATMAVAPEYRGEATNGLVSLFLYQALAMMAPRGGARWICAILDLVVLDLIQNRVHRPFGRFDGIDPMPYLDSPASLPVIGDLEDHAQRMAFLDPASYELLYGGIGLEAVVSAPDWDAIFAPAPAAALAAVG